MITHIYDLDVVPGAVPVVVPLKQYSDDVILVFNVFSRFGVLDLGTGVTVAIRGTKPDGNGISINVSLNGNAVTVQVDKQMVAAAGKALYELVFSRNGKEFITASFILYVQRAALDKDTLKSESKIKELVNIIDRTDEIIAAANKAKEQCDSIKDMYNNTVTMNDNVNEKSANVDLKAEEKSFYKSI